MKNCKNCGAQLADDDDYCYFCGKPVSEVEERPVNTNYENHNDRYTNNYQNNYNTQPRNGIALAGFIVAFFSPIVGLVLSIIGLNKSKTMNGLGRKHAIAGIIISIVNFIFSFFIYYIYYAAYYGGK